MTQNGNNTNGLSTDFQLSGHITTTTNKAVDILEFKFVYAGYQPNMSSTNAGERPQVELPSNAQGLSTPEALSIVLRRAEQLLGQRAIIALSVMNTYLLHI